MADLTVAQERHAARIAAIDEVVAKVAKECGVTRSAVRVVWWNTDLGGTKVSYVASGPFVGKPRKPRNVHLAVKAGALEPYIVELDWLWTLHSYYLTPFGRRILWRIHEELEVLCG